MSILSDILHILLDYSPQPPLQLHFPYPHLQLITNCSLHQYLRNRLISLSLNSIFDLVTPVAR